MRGKNKLTNKQPALEKQLVVVEREQQGQHRPLPGPRHSPGREHPPRPPRALVQAGAALGANPCSPGPPLAWLPGEQRFWWDFWRLCAFVEMRVNGAAGVKAAT